MKISKIAFSHQITIVSNILNHIDSSMEDVTDEMMDQYATLDAIKQVLRHLAFGTLVPEGFVPYLKTKKSELNDTELRNKYSKLIRSFKNGDFSIISEVIETIKNPVILSLIFSSQF